MIVYYRTPLIDHLTLIYFMNLRHLNKKFTFKPAQINTGWCFVWALYAREVNPFAQLYTYTQSGQHAWVKISGKYYDAEKPLGVRDWKQLPFFNGYPPNESHLLKQSIRDFVKYWDSCGAGDIPHHFKRRYL